MKEEIGKKLSPFLQYDIRPSLSTFLILVIAASSIYSLSFFSLGSTNLRFDDLVALLLLPIIIFTGGRIRISRSISWYIGFLGLTFVSIANGLFFLNVPIIVRDFFEIIRLSKIPIIALFVLSSDDETNKLLISNFDIFIILSAILQILIAIYQTVSLYDIVTIFESVFHGHMLNIRINGSSSNSNNGCFIITIHFYYLLVRYFHTKRFSQILISLLLLISAVLTGSRTGIAALFCGSIIAILLFSGLKKKFKIIIVVLVSLFILYLGTKISYVSIGVQSLLSGKNNSWNVRLQNFQDAFALFQKSPLFGWGPAKEIHTTNVDGEYFLVLRRYGLFGIVALFFHIAVKLSSDFKAVAQGNSMPLLDITRKTTILVLISGLILMLTNNFFSGYEISTIYAIFLGISSLQIKATFNNFVWAKK